MDILRSVGVYARAQEVLAASNYFDYAAVWRISRIFERICSGTLYLYPVLARWSGLWRLSLSKQDM